MTQPALFDETIPALPEIRVNATVHPVETSRLSKQCQSILERLRAGNATNRELSVIALKYTGRLSELRKSGYRVEVCHRNYETGITVYSLMPSDQ